MELLRAEWTKLRTVRGWVGGLVAAGVLTVVAGLLTGQGSPSGCRGEGCEAPVGPGGEQVSDSFYFVHQPLAGDGSITVQVTSLTGDDALEPWAKAGLMVKDSLVQGSTYAAVMVTGDHGVRMQHDFTHDIAGSQHGAPVWLRLARSGPTITGYESTDGQDWNEVGSVRLNGLSSTAQVGLFTTSPFHSEAEQDPFSLSISDGPTRATAGFDHVELEGAGAGDDWTGETVGNDPVLDGLGGFEDSGGTFTVSGAGNIAPATAGLDQAAERTLIGTMLGLIAVVVVGAMFVGAEYRRGLIATTLAATPQRGRVLAAKVAVLGTASFVVGLVSAFVAVQLGQSIAESGGRALIPISSATEVRIVVGTAALFALASVFGLALGTVQRRGAGAVTAALALIVVPYLLATASVLPNGPAEWLLRLTPAAGFSVQQTLVEHAQVDNLYAPANGYFPLPPWAGLLVLCGYTAVALVLATVSLRRRDA